MRNDRSMVSRMIRSVCGAVLVLVVAIQLVLTQTSLARLHTPAGVWSGSHGDGTGSSNNAAQSLVMVQVFHRHGARTPLVPVNQTLICGPRGNASCGVLTDVGKAQLTSLGQWLRSRYTTLIPELNASDSYDYFVTYSRSTNLPRTLQSSASMLRGLFPKIENFYPAISTVRFALDRLCLVDALMSYHILEELGGYFIMSNASMSLFSEGTLRQMAAETNLQGACGVFPAQYVECAGSIQDVAASANSAGTLQSQFPTVYAQYDNLSAFRRAINEARFPYDPNITDQRNRGSLGYLLANRLVSNFLAAKKSLADIGEGGEMDGDDEAEQFTAPMGNADDEAAVRLDAPKRAVIDRDANLNAPAGGSPAPGGAAATAPWPLPRIIEYSIHDTTMMPLSATLGHNELMLPLFGETLVVEMWRDTISNDLTVRVMSGRPNQSPTNQTMDVGYITTVCQAPNGTVYQSIEGCPLDDFWAFVNSSAPLSPFGSCYLPESAFKAIGCDTLDTPSSDTAPLCVLFRQRCPAAGCPKGNVVDTATLACVATAPRPSLVTPTITIVEVLAAVVVGCFVAVTVADAVNRRRLQAATNDAERSRLVNS